jgi:hypothetical protein
MATRRRSALAAAAQQRPTGKFAAQPRENRRLLHDRYLHRTRIGSEFLCAAAIDLNDPELGMSVSTAPGVNENRSKV